MNQIMSNRNLATDVLVDGLTVALERETHAPYSQISTIIKDHTANRIPTPVGFEIKIYLAKNLGP